MKKSFLALFCILCLFIIFLPTDISAEEKTSDPGPILDDMRIPEDYFKKDGFYFSSTEYGTSDYMYGNISVAIILPESNGSIDSNLENWTQEEINNVKNEIQQGLQWWVTNKHDLAQVNFFIHEPLILETSYEPITRNHTDQTYWINDTMASLGYNSGSSSNKLRAYDEDLIIQDNTDWAFTIFVVDSSNDADGMFADEKFTYANIGGPFMVMTYNNSLFHGIGDMDFITAHEAGHIFRAGDEYNTTDGPCVCTDKYGFLDVENQNCYNGCLSTEDCIMSGLEESYVNNALEYYTEGQIGWRDDDNDNIIDCIDSTYNPNGDYDGDGIVDYWDSDDDNDGILDVNDNCDFVSNPLQQDNYPPGGNGIGDACECEGNFDGDSDQDGTDAALFKQYFGRSKFQNPCTNISSCKGDFDCDQDVDGTDASLFKQDFGRWSVIKPCPVEQEPINESNPWCSYE